jgi:hypothetical protein
MFRTSMQSVGPSAGEIQASVDVDRDGRSSSVRALHEHQPHESAADDRNAIAGPQLQ